MGLLLNQRLRRLPWRSLERWWIVGLASFVGGIGFLFLFKNLLGLSLIWATTVTAEVVLLLRYLVNDRWVFGHRSPSWIRLWQFHVASAAGGAIWWAVANTGPRFGVHYLVASTAGTAMSVCFSMVTNFLWVWRKKGQAEAAGASVPANARPR